MLRLKCHTGSFYIEIRLKQNKNVKHVVRSKALATQAKSYTILSQFLVENLRWFLHFFNKEKQ